MDPWHGFPDILSGDRPFGGLYLYMYCIYIIYIYIYYSNIYIYTYITIFQGDLQPIL